MASFRVYYALGELELSRNRVSAAKDSLVVLPKSRGPQSIHTS